jgi:transcription initiation factor IIE alpha subunit
MIEIGERKAVASLIFFADHVEKERVEKWIEKLKEQGHVVGSTTREYDPAIGEPVWYIP